MISRNLWRYSPFIFACFIAAAQGGFGYVAAADPTPDSAYTLGPEDSVSIHVKDEPEIPDGPYQIDLKGDLAVPEIGSFHVSGMTVAQLTAAVSSKCQRFLKEPVVSVSVSDYRSQRVSVLGAVSSPGVQQVRGRKTLFEAISDAGGLKPNAGGVIQISRRTQEGPLPLPNAVLDPKGQFETASIEVATLMRAKIPEANVALKANDVITVPKAELVYVLGAVKKPGGFELAEKQHMSVMQALSLAEGPERTASTKHARILREKEGDSSRVEIAVDLNRVIAGKELDVQLQPNDILVVPNSAAKSASYRALEAVVNTGTGVAIYHPF